MELKCNGNEKISRKNTIISAIWIFTLAFLFSLKCPMNVFQVGVSGTDSSVFQYVARVILRGGMPYVDAFDHKGPLLYLINVVGLLINQWRGIWLVELGTLYITFLLIYKTARLMCSRRASHIVVLCATAALFSYFEGGNMTEEYAMPCIAAALYIFLDYFLNSRIGKVRLLVCGMTFGAVCLLRINMAVIWAVMCVAVLIQCIAAKQYKQLIFFLTYFVLGFVLFVGPILIWLAANGALSACVQDYLLFNLSYSSDPIRASGANKASATLEFLNNSFVLTALAVSIFLAEKKKDIFHYAYILFIVCSVLVTGMSGQKYMHYGMIFIPMLTYPFACVASMVCNEYSKNKSAVLVIFLILLVKQVFPVWISAADNGIKQYYSQAESYMESTAAKTRNIIRCYTQDDDEIIVCGNWNIVYNLSNRFAASRYSYQAPIGDISSEIREEFFEDLRENMPKVIVLSKKSIELQRTMDFIDEYGYVHVWQSDDGKADIYLRGDSQMSDIVWDKENE